MCKFALNNSFLAKESKVIPLGYVLYGSYHEKNLCSHIDILQFSNALFNFSTPTLNETQQKLI